MDQKLRSGLVLIALLVSSAVLLTATERLTRERISQARAELYGGAIQEVFPEADSIVDSGGYSSVYKDQRLLGYASEGKAYGYSSYVRVLSGFSPDGRIIGVKVLSQAETPGIGLKISEEEFLSGFSGLEIADARLERYGGRIDGITGATISSNAVSLAVRDAYGRIWEAPDV